MLHTAALPALLVVVGIAIGSVPCVLHRCGEVCEYHCLACDECYCEVCDDGFGCKGDVGISSNDAAVVDGETFALKEYLAPRLQVQEATMDILAVAPASELRADAEAFVFHASSRFKSTRIAAPSAGDGQTLRNKDTQPLLGACIGFEWGPPPSSPHPSPPPPPPSHSRRWPLMRGGGVALDAAASLCHEPASVALARGADGRWYEDTRGEEFVARSYCTASAAFSKLSTALMLWAEVLDVPRSSGVSGGPDALLVELVRRAVATGVVGDAPAGQGRATVLFTGSEMHVVGLLLAQQQAPHTIVLMAISPEVRGRALSMWCYEHHVMACKLLPGAPMAVDLKDCGTRGGALLAWNRCGFSIAAAGREAAALQRAGQRMLLHSQAPSPAEIAQRRLRYKPAAAAAAHGHVSAASGQASLVHDVVNVRSSGDNCTVDRSTSAFAADAESTLSADGSSAAPTVDAEPTRVADQPPAAPTVDTEPIRAHARAVDQPFSAITAAVEPSIAAAQPPAALTAAVESSLAAAGPSAATDPTLAAAPLGAARPPSALSQSTVLLSSGPDLPAASAGWTGGRARSIAEVHAVRTIGKEALGDKDGLLIGRGDFRRDFGQLISGGRTQCLADALAHGLEAEKDVVRLGIGADHCFARATAYIEEAFPEWDLVKSTEHFRVAGGIAFALLNAICGRFVLSMSYMHDGIKRYHCAYFYADFEWQREDLESGRTVCGRGVLKDNQSDVPVHLAMASDRSNADAARAFFDEPYGLAMRIEAVYELVARGTKRQKCGAICQVQHGGLPGPSPGVLADVHNVLHHRDTQAPSQRRISKAGSAAHGAPRNVLLRQLEQCRDHCERADNECTSKGERRGGKFSEHLPLLRGGGTSADSSGEETDGAEGAGDGERGDGERSDGEQGDGEAGGAPGSYEALRSANIARNHEMMRQLGLLDAPLLLATSMVKGRRQRRARGQLPGRRSPRLLESPSPSYVYKRSYIKKQGACPPSEAPASPAAVTTAIVPRLRGGGDCATTRHSKRNCHRHVAHIVDVPQASMCGAMSSSSAVACAPLVVYVPVVMPRDGRELWLSAADAAAAVVLHSRFAGNPPPADPPTPPPASAVVVAPSAAGYRQLLAKYGFAPTDVVLLEWTHEAFEEGTSAFEMAVVCDWRQVKRMWLDWPASEQRVWRERWWTAPVVVMAADRDMSVSLSDPSIVSFSVVHRSDVVDAVARILEAGNVRRLRRISDWTGDACSFVRTVEHGHRIALSTRHGGDIESFIPSYDGKLSRAGKRRATSIAGGDDDAVDWQPCEHRDDGEGSVSDVNATERSKGDDVCAVTLGLPLLRGGGKVMGTELHGLPVPSPAACVTDAYLDALHLDGSGHPLGVQACSNAKGEVSFERASGGWVDGTGCGSGDGTRQHAATHREVDRVYAAAYALPSERRCRALRRARDRRRRRVQCCAHHDRLCARRMAHESVVRVVGGGEGRPKAPYLSPPCDGGGGGCSALLDYGCGRGFRRAAPDADGSASALAAGGGRKTNEDEVTAPFGGDKFLQSGETAREFATASLRLQGSGRTLCEASAAAIARRLPLPWGDGDYCVGCSTEPAVHVAVEGSIGVGKSTVLAALADRFAHDPRIVVLPEAVDVWRAAGLLHGLYAGLLPKLAFQLVALVSGAAPLLQALHRPGVRVVVTEGSPSSNRHVYAAVNLRGGDAVAYNVAHNALTDALPALRETTVLLDASVEVARQRIAMRGRVEERELPASYLAALHRARESLFASITHDKYRLNAACAPCKVAAALGAIVEGLVEHGWPLPIRIASVPRGVVMCVHRMARRSPLRVSTAAEAIEEMNAHLSLAPEAATPSGGTGGAPKHANHGVSRRFRRTGREARATRRPRKCLAAAGEVVVLPLLRGGGGVAAAHTEVKMVDELVDMSSLNGERNRQAQLQMRRRRDEKRACATAESSLYKLHASTGARLRANSRRVRTLPLAGYDESSDAYLTAKQDASEDIENFAHVTVEDGANAVRAFLDCETEAADMHVCGACGLRDPRSGLAPSSLVPSVCLPLLRGGGDSLGDVEWERRVADGNAAANVPNVAASSNEEQAGGSGRPSSRQAANPPARVLRPRANGQASGAALPEAPSVAFYQGHAHGGSRLAECIWIAWMHVDRGAFADAWVSSAERARMPSHLGVIVTYIDVRGEWHPVSVATESATQLGQWGYYCARQFGGGEYIGAMLDAAAPDRPSRYLIKLRGGVRDGAASRPGGPRCANDPRGSGLPANAKCYDNGWLAVAPFAEIAPLRPDLTLRERRRREVLWDYGDHYWARLQQHLPHPSPPTSPPDIEQPVDGGAVPLGADHVTLSGSVMDGGAALLALRGSGCTKATGREVASGDVHRLPAEMVHGRNADALARAHPLPGDPHLTFDEATHTYTVYGQAVQRSVTALVGALFEAFDSERCTEQHFERWARDPQSRYHAQIEGVPSLSLLPFLFLSLGLGLCPRPCRCTLTVTLALTRCEDVRERGGSDADAAAAIRRGWEQLGQEASRLGTALHLHAELHTNGVVSATDAPLELQREVEQFGAFLRSEFGARLQALRTELAVAWRADGGRAVTAGQVDCLYKDSEGCVIMVDFKRVASKHSLEPWARAFGGAYGRPPVELLPDTPFWRYSLQQSLYAVMLKQVRIEAATPMVTCMGMSMLRCHWPILLVCVGRRMASTAVTASICCGSMRTATRTSS